MKSDFECLFSICKFFILNFAEKGSVKKIIPDS